MRARYFIAVCDILGFSELVQKGPLDSVVSDALNWFRSALNQSIHGGQFPVRPPRMDELSSHPKVGVTWFSDTILLYGSRIRTKRSPIW
jgi:hypothetical protein